MSKTKILRNQRPCDHSIKSVNGLDSNNFKSVSQFSRRGSLSALMSNVATEIFTQRRNSSAVILSDIRSSPNKTAKMLDVSERVRISQVRVIFLKMLID